MPVHAPRAKHHTIRRLVPLLLEWFASHARDLPWRRTRDPYAIWISEVMLQQTQVKTVIPYWERWMRELPTIQATAKASPAKLHKLWAGLGYYARARNLQRAARQIVANSRRDELHESPTKNTVGDSQSSSVRFPENFDDILALPGVGRYTAGAIASIAFNQPRPILDGNVIRVLARIFGLTTNPREKETNARLWRLAEELVFHASRLTPHALERGTKTRTKDEDGQNCSRLNQSLMELGALVCTPRSPRCGDCPARHLCLARKRNWQTRLPNLGQRARPTDRCFRAFLVERHGKFLVRQRPAGGWNAHLWEFPNAEMPGTPALPGADFRLTATKPLCVVKHSITRYRIRLEVYRAELTSSQTEARDHWLTLPQLRRLAFSSAHKKILDQIAKPLGVRRPAFRPIRNNH